MCLVVLDILFCLLLVDLFPLCFLVVVECFCGAQCGCCLESGVWCISLHWLALFAILRKCFQVQLGLLVCLVSF